MPTYEYRRKDGTIFEVRQGINDKPLGKCPETDQKVTRIISGGGGVMYKGEGWYVTDYKKQAPSPPGDHSETGSSTKKGDPTSGESKPAAPES